MFLLFRAHRQGAAHRSRRWAAPFSRHATDEEGISLTYLLVRWLARPIWLPGRPLSALTELLPAATTVAGLENMGLRWWRQTQGPATSGSQKI